MCLQGDTSRSIFTNHRPSSSAASRRIEVAVCLAMDSSKDFAKSKRKATQRHTPGRGGRDFAGSKKRSAKAELGSNVER